MYNSPMGMGQQPAGLSPVPPLRPTTPPPLPPPPEITLRTMQSDMEGLKLTGGSGSMPKPFTPPELMKELSRPMATLPPMPKLTPSDFGSGRPMPSPAPQIETEVARSNWGKMFLWGGVLILIAGVGVAGYFYVYPMMFPKLLPAPPAPAVTIPPQAEVPAQEMPIDGIPEMNNEPPLEELTTQMRAHTSLLAGVAGVSSVTLTTLDLTSLKLALQREAAKNAPANSLTEITLSDANGQLSAATIVPLMLPELSADTIKKLFADDFTTALYRDANGVWPVYILKVSPDSSQVEAQPAVAALEVSPNLANLFVSAPGAKTAATFKTGTKINEVTIRYMPFTKTGASLNIGWSGNNLIISTSYNGMKKTIGSLVK